MSCSLRKICPDVGLSNPAKQCSSVDFPEPDGPIIAVNSFSLNSTLISSKALTLVSFSPYTFVKFDEWIILFMNSILGYEWIY